MRLNKIVATLGPSIESKWILKQIDKYVDVYRINLSHADLIKTRKLIKTIREIDDKKVFMIDTKWPEIRTTNEEITVNKWDIIKVYNTKKEGFVSFEYKFFENIPENIEISFNDKAVIGNVIKNNKEFLEVEIIQWWTIGYNKTVNFIWYEIELDFLTEKDKKDLKFAIEENIALIAVSFVKTAQDIIDLRNFIKEEFDGYDMKIIAKIETESAVKNIKEIIKVSDGIMIARWDLWANINMIKLPQIQEEIIKYCNIAWKPVILATQVMSSMVNKAVPTRAEIDEIAYSIEHWVDALMLSDETAIWKYPVETLKFMDEVIREYQFHIANKKFSWEEINEFVNENNLITDYILYNAKKIAYKLKAKYIVTPTESGYSPGKMSALKPKMPIIAFTTSDKVFKYCNLMFGVKAIKVWEGQCAYKNFKRIVWETLQLQFRWKIKWDDKIVITHSTIADHQTNMINGLEVIKFKDL